MTHPLLGVRNVVKVFGAPPAETRAVRGVTFEVARGETLGIVGESGSGKTTLARCIVRLADVTSGQIVFDGTDITAMRGDALRPFRRRVQMVFQDPWGSLNPRHRVGTIVGEPLLVHGVGTRDERRARVSDLLVLVGLGPVAAERYPAEFSGGQRQRIGIARALALRPELLVCDEPVSALDVSIRAQVLNLLADLRDSLGLTLVFVSHDLDVVRYLCDRVAVMHSGAFVEVAPADQLFASPTHEYTQSLLASRLAVPRSQP